MSETLTDLDIRPLSDALGAEIHGVDLSQPLDDATVAAIKDAWHEHIVLLFRDQDLLCLFIFQFRLNDQYLPAKQNSH